MILSPKTWKKSTYCHIEHTNMEKKKIRPKLCAWCKVKFQPERHLQPCCCVDHAIKKMEADKAKKTRKKKAECKKAILTRTERLAKAQVAFNAYIRCRDKDQPCIVCGTHHNAQYQAGHFYTRGARADLRFNEHNCFKQCARTNRYTSVDTAEKFRKNVIARIGQEEFDKLSIVGRSDWSDEEINEIERTYKAKLKELRK